MNNPAVDDENSAAATRARFDSLASSMKYAGALDNTPRHRREIRCLDRCLANLPPGARVLDLPCGAGRLLPHLAGKGYRLHAADSSPHMLARARELAAREQLPGDIEYGVEDVLATSFADDSFDAVVCNRLFHHFHEAQTRVAALQELRRISRGPVIISFFCSRSLSSMAFLLKNRLRRVPAVDRVPIPLRTMLADVAAAGLKVDLCSAARPLLSKQWYLKLSAIDRGQPTGR
jgi:SAM-dependent methyltransferase